MSIWVHENAKAKRVRIHAESCRYCKPAEATQNDIWHGPFETFDDANRVAASLGYDDMRACGTCKPENAAAATADPKPKLVASPAKPEKTSL